MASRLLVSPLQSYTFYTKYARYRPELGRRETYEEAVKRVCDMHRTRYPAVADEIDLVERAMLDGLVLGSQRALQFGGEQILNKHARIYNCSASACDRPRFFQEAFWLLLCGCGVGFSVQWHHVERLPRIAKPSTRRVVYQIPDSIEGWSDALGVLLSSYFVDQQPFPEYHGATIAFDYSAIRPEGSLIAGGIGKAPGPKPLERSLEAVRRVLDACLDRGQTALRPIDAYDVVMHVSNAVLSGGVRRSATICIFSPDDHDMATAKTGNWYVDNPQRARSNNSALLLRDSTSFEQFAKLMQSVKEFGEPGFVWSDSTEVIFNPCVEVSLYPFDVETGESGWQFCNLSEINVSACQTRDDFERAATAAAIVGTLQAGYTDFPYLGQASERITRREALLGVSMTGMLENPGISLDGDFLETMAKHVIATNERVARRIGINPAARTTCVKPSGTASCMLGTCSGVHPHHARRYLRHVRANKYEPYVEAYRRMLPEAVEPCVWDANQTDVVLTFCVEAKPSAIIKDDMTAIQFLDIVRQTQQRWVRPGRVAERCVKPFLCHNVSNTVSVRDQEWESVTKYIYEHRHDFTGISLLPETGDVDYPQAPFVRVYSVEELMERYPYDAVMWACHEAYQTRREQRQVWASYRAHGAPKAAALADASLRFSMSERELYELLALAEAFYIWCDVYPKQSNIAFGHVEEHHQNTNHLSVEACAGGQCDLSSDLYQPTHRMSNTTATQPATVIGVAASTEHAA